MSKQRTEVAICEVCGVDHSRSMADLSHGIIRLIQHAQERMPWQEWPVSGDHIARVRARQSPGGLIGIVDWDQLEGEEG